MTTALRKVFSVGGALIGVAGVGAFTGSSGLPAHAGLFDESLSRSYTVRNDVTLDHVFGEAISRGYSVRNHAVRLPAFNEAISRGLTVRNHTVRPSIFGEVISRSYTVANNVAQGDAFDEAISRGYTIRNHTLRPHAFDESISRSYTIRNHATRAHDFDEAISRGYTVRNNVLRRHTFSEAISRSYTVVNHPQLTIRLEAGSEGCELQARCGAAVPYRILGELSDGNNEGLAMFGLTLAFDGGDLPPAGTPTGELTCENPMVNFARPWGFTEPNGFGGTAVNGKLVHVGGGQNTFNNTEGDWPTGGVLPRVAQPSGCGPATLVTGTLIAPDMPGTYHLRIENAFATAIEKGATGEPFWPVRPVVVNAGNELSIEVIEPGCGGITAFEYSLFLDCFAGPGSAPAPPLAYITPCECLCMFDDDHDGDVDLADFPSIQNGWVPGICPQHIVSSDPPNCDIDARQPTDAAYCIEPTGFESITLNMACPTAGLTASDFSVTTVPEGATPTIVDVTASQRTATLELSQPIAPGRWTCFTHNDSGRSACLGFLPGDVNNDLIVNVADLTVPGFYDLPLYRCDIDDDGVCTEADLVRLEELLFGDGCFDFWLGRSLPACPSGP